MTDTSLTTETRPRPSMAVGGNVGALIPQDIEQAFRIASALAQSGMTPNGFKTPETCFVAIMAGAELGLPPFQSLQSFAIINGRPTLYGAALMAVIRTNGFKVREWFDGEGDELTAYCELTRPDNGDVNEASFSVGDAKTAKLWGKAGPWVTNPKRMLQWRARGFCFTDGAADVLKGLQIREAVEYDEPLPATTEPTRTGSGLLAKLEANQTLATEGFGIRDVTEEAGEAAPTAEPKKRAPRKAKEQSALEAIAEAEPEIVEQVVADHGPVDADFSPVEPQEPVEGVVMAAEVEAPSSEPETATAIQGPAPADTPYFHADKEAFPSGRRVAYVNGVAQAETPDDGTLPVYTEHAPEPVAPKSAPAAEAPAEPTPESPSPSPSDESTSASNTASPDGGVTTASPSEPTDPFDAFDTVLMDATSWAELRPALDVVSRTPEWKERHEDRVNARVDVWEKVSVWNEQGARLDPADDALLFQCYVTATDDREAIEGIYALAQDMQWLRAASDGMKEGVRVFVGARLAELG